jgi:predicted dinucleotide-binding enzyme
MNIGVLGSGMVGEALASKLVSVGHHVMMGSREAKSPSAEKWLKAAGAGARTGTFAEASAFGELVFNCTNGANSLAALRQAGAEPLRGKTLVDVANPIEPAGDAPPKLTICNTDSLGEQLQREFPDTNVVKALNTINCQVMVQPSLVPGDHHLFVCGNDPKAKQDVADKISQWFGWKRQNIIDLGDIRAARATEMYLAIWMRLWGVLGTPQFNIRVVRAAR